MPPLLECLPYIGVTSVTRGTVCTLHRVNIYAGSVDWGTYNGGNIHPLLWGGYKVYGVRICG